MLLLNVWLLLTLATFSKCSTDSTKPTTVLKLEEKPVAQPDKRDVSGPYAGTQTEEPFRPVLQVPYGQKKDPVPTRPVQYQNGVLQVTGPQAPGNNYHPQGRVTYSPQVQTNGYIGNNQQQNPNVYRGPYNPNYIHQQHLKEPQYEEVGQKQIQPELSSGTHRHETNYDPAAGPAQTVHHSRPAPQQKPIYYQTSGNAYQPTAPQQPAPQPVRYVLAVPHSYLMQLQSQYAARESASVGQAPIMINHPQIRVIGPLARDNQGVYRPIHQNVNIAPAPAPSQSAPQKQFVTQYIQIPVSALVAAAQNAHIHSPKNYQVNFQRSPFSYQVPTNSYYQKQAVQEPQQVNVYQERQQIKPQSQPILKTENENTPSNSNQQNIYLQSPKAAVSTAAPIASSASPISHYNPIYVQPAPQQQLQAPVGPLYYQQQPQRYQVQAPVSLVRFIPNNPLFAPSLPSQYVQPMHSYNPAIAPTHATHAQAQSHIAVSFAPNSVPYANPTAHTAHPNQGNYEAQAAALPYFHHGGGIHYGTHLYHPHLPSLALHNHHLQRQQLSHHQLPHQQPQLILPQTQAHQQPGTADAAPTLDKTPENNSNGNKVVAKYS